MKPYYQDEQTIIYHADCYGAISNLSFDVIITDPPYILDVGSGGISKKRQYIRDIKGFTDEGFDMSILDKSSCWMCFCSKNQLIELLSKANSDKDGRWMLLTWNKPNPTPLVNNTYLSDTEYIVHKFVKNRLYGDYHNKARFIVHPARQNLMHPNEKPLEVMHKLILCASDIGQTVLDPFMGSGSTLVACKFSGRKAIGIELDEKYCEVAARRLQQGVFEL